MVYLHLFAQTFLDTLAMYLLCSFIAKQPVKLTKKSIYWFILFQLFCFMVRLNFIVDSDVFIQQVDFMHYDLLPVNSMSGMIFLLLALLMLNSLFFKLTNTEVMLTTALAFVLWILVRLVSIGIVGLLIDSNLFIYTYSYRGLTILFAYLIYAKFSIALLKSYSAGRSIFTKMMLANTLLVIGLLMVYANFDTAILLKNILYVTIGLSFVLLMNIWIVLEQKNTARREKRVDVIEHYLPVIDELVSEVRARQHEFDNKLLAITSILETAEDLTSAKEQIQQYTNHVVIEGNLKELLLSDSKVVAGFLYTKEKLAALKKIQLKTEIHTGFQDVRVEEYEIVEILGILLDNAIEACQPYDEIHVQINRLADQLEIKVSNPHPHLSNAIFMRMFERGFTTKNIHAKERGFGLYNVKQIVLQHNGKLITKNREVGGRNYVTIGVQLP